MPEFRKWILALAVVALFAGVASAQIGTPGVGTAGNFTCTTTPNGAVTPTLRTEGYTELAGDILIQCSGGAPPALGTLIPTANITIFMNAAVTSRLLSSSPTAGSGTVSEALLMIDEPGSADTGYGPQVPQTLCTSPAFGAGPGGTCQQWVGQTAIGSPGPTMGVPVSVNPNTGPGGTYVPSNQPPGANVFEGVVFGNQVTFFGIPILPPTTTGLTRVFRITNIRTNANQITGGGISPGSVVASISTNGSTSLPIPNPTVTVGFVQPGLNASVRNAANSGGGGGTSFAQCNSVSVTSTSSTATASGGGLQFQENFATAFKVRVMGAGGMQNIPGAIYNAESGFTLSAATATPPSASGVSYLPGYADYGTRLKAVFSNVPSGVSIFVSTRDLTNSFSAYAPGQNAVLVVSETASDGGGPVTSIPAAFQTGTYVGPAPAGATTVGIAPVVLSAGVGQAVWEIIAANQATIDTDFFGVYINYSASPATNSPAPGTMSVTLSFAPTPSGGAFTAAQAAAASASLTIPRFSDSLDTTKTFATFALCTTNLLYPYVINVNGFDTGLAIANTTTDPFGTSPQAGTCSLNFYGAAQPSAAFITPVVATGTVYANLASTLAPGFDGYMIAVCNFQLAHGFAFVSDVGARNLAMGYLALILPTPRNTTPEALNN